MTIPTTGSKGSRRGRDSGASTSPPAVTDSWTVPPGGPPPATEPPPAEPAEPLIYAEPVVEGEAVELPAAEPATPVYEPPVPLTLQGATATAADSGEAFASGHAAAPGPSWQEPLMELANERPEVVVGAAFAGGLLTAMILRRLGN